MHHGVMPTGSRFGSAFVVGLLVGAVTFGLLLPFGREAEIETHPVVDGTAAGVAGEGAVLWRRVEELVPEEVLAEIVTFEVFSDPETSGWSEPVDPEGWHWALGLERGLADHPAELDATIVHEVAHIVTLDADQVEPAPNPSRRRKLLDPCPTYLAVDVCVRDGGHLDAFFEAFWEGQLYEEWLRIHDLSDDAAYEEAFGRFTASYGDRFVSEYAATSPDEDLAETFQAWVLGDDDAVVTPVVADKFRFLDGRAELADLRLEIRRRLAAAGAAGDATVPAVDVLELLGLDTLLAQFVLAVGLAMVAGNGFAIIQDRRARRPADGGDFRRARAWWLLAVGAVISAWAGTSLLA